MNTNSFVLRHNGPRITDVEKMLVKLGVKSLDELIDKTIPASIRLKSPINVPLKGMSEHEFLAHIKEIGMMNKIYKTYIGMGYYSTLTPSVILRNVLENPGWYTSYTPYQAEISQGRLEALLNYQTMICDLTAMPLTNCSLLDEGTAAAEAMVIAFYGRSREATKANAIKFFVDNNVFPQTKGVLETRSAPLGIEIVYGDYKTFKFDSSFYGGLVQYPDGNGQVNDYKAFADDAHANNAVMIVAADIMSLVLLTPPGEFGADMVCGSVQRFGLPMGYGGPHAGYLATKEDYKRFISGRIIGITVDAKGNRALRLSLQTREQHIKRDKATSNICTAQALLAIMAGAYAVYHGPEGLKSIATHIHKKAGVLSNEIEKYGYKQLNTNIFDTLNIQLPEGVTQDDIRQIALENEVNFRYFEDGKRIGISIDETTTLHDVNLIVYILAVAAGKEATEIDCQGGKCCPAAHDNNPFKRTTAFLTNDTFNKYHDETSMMRYLKLLENKDLALNRTMIPLGSCTMKLNAASEMLFMSWPEWGQIHPFVPIDQAEGYTYLFEKMNELFSAITGFAAMSFQPNSGAAGEYTGLMVIRQYHLSRGDDKRNICLIPASAHGTNPASATLAGMKIVIVKSDANGNVDIDDLRTKAEQYKDTLSCLMITYPSTHGIFEEGILEIMDIIHKNGGQVYMDGANMNAQVGLTSPGHIGADVCHLNLHKTFANPHGGGGPGIGPIGVAKHLVEFLPSHSVVKVGGNNGITAVSSAQYGSAMINPIAYGYVMMLGAEGLAEATRYAILNANYLMESLKEYYPILYRGANGFVAHEMILDCNKFLMSANVTVGDIAKRLMDYGFHAPTVAFPVIGTLMVEPTESEPLAELDRFVEAMIGIRKEIEAIETGKADRNNNLIKNAPHTVLMVTSNEWEYPYTREEAAYPVENLRTNKYFTPVTRVDDAFGDRNLVCTCN